MHPRSFLFLRSGAGLGVGEYFILLDIVDPRTESNPNPNPNPEPNPNPNPNPDPNCGFAISHKMKYLRGGWGWERLQSSICIFRVLLSSANACNPLAEDLSIKEMLNFRHKASRWLTVARGSKSVWRMCFAY